MFKSDETKLRMSLKCLLDRIHLGLNLELEVKIKHSNVFHYLSFWLTSYCKVRVCEVPFLRGSNSAGAAGLKRLQ